MSNSPVVNATPSSRWAAHIAMLGANMGWGIMSPISKSLLLQGTISPLALSGIRITGGALLFLIFSWILPAGFKTREHIDRSDWWRILLCSALIISANQGLYILGIGYTNPVDSAVMSSLTPIFTMLLAAVCLGLAMTWLKVFGVVIGLTGVVILVADSAQSEIAINPLLGNLLCMAAQMCAAIYYVGFSRLIDKYSPYTLMKWLFFLSVVSYVPLCIPDMAQVDYASLTFEAWFDITYIIVVATFLGYLLIPFSQRSLSPTAVSMYSYLQPVFAAIMAVLLGVGDFGWIKAGAALLIFFGIALVNKVTTRG